MGYNCSFAARVKDVKPYGDIAGPGVITGFLGSAWLAVIFVLLHYLFVFDPYENPFQSSDGDNSSESGNSWRANPIDSLVKRVINKGLRRMKIGLGWTNGLEMSILSMCDVQFVTGLGILVSGFIDLLTGISAYHFNIVTNLAWFSNLTHICGLTVLRKYFHSRPTEKLIRMICMIILALMLLAAIGPTLSFNWKHPDEGTTSLNGTDAICFYDPFRSAQWHRRSKWNLGDFTDSTAYQSGTMSIVLLVFTFVSRMIKFYPPFLNRLKRLRNYSEALGAGLARMLVNRATENTGIRSLRIRRALLMGQVANILVVRLYCDIIMSTLSDLYWLVVSATWGTIKLFMAKSGETLDEKEWTFGQVLPAFLLIGPIAIAIKGAFEGQSSNLPFGSTGLTMSTEQIIPNGNDAVTDNVENSTESFGMRELPSTTGPMTPTDQPFSESNELVTSDPDRSVETRDMREFRENLSTYLERDYYDTATCTWIIPVFLFMCIQILEATVLIFLELVLQRSSATDAVSTVSLLIFICIPSAIHFMFTVCISFDWRYGGRHGTAFSVLVSALILGVYSMYPVWGYLYNPASLGNRVVLRKYGFKIMLWIASGYSVILIAGLTAPFWIFGRAPRSPSTRNQL